jgi:hypothetical protein
VFVLFIHFHPNSAIPTLQKAAPKSNSINVLISRKKNAKKKFNRRGSFSVTISKRININCDFLLSTRAIHADSICNSKVVTFMYARLFVVGLFVVGWLDKLGVIS